MIRVRILSFLLSLGVVAIGLSGMPQAQAQKVEHPHLHHALRELREARHELKEAGHDFGGHREKALLAVDRAVEQLEKALKFAGDPHPEKGAGRKEKEEFKGHHPHLRQAIHELKETRHELKEAKHDFGGHREKALHATDHAIEQLELALKFANRK
jgi:LPS O-antigen subunit length determinant protein (WzzB/FepE family)